MGTTEAHTHPWDDPTLVLRLLDVVRELPRVRFDLLDVPSQPGIYLHFFSLPDGPLARALGPAGRGEKVGYVGVAAGSLRSRLGRYRQAFDGVSAIQPDHVYCAVLPCSTKAASLWAEAALIHELRPPLNATGYGARHPGTGRPGRIQRGVRTGCSYWDALCPGRAWAARPNAADITAAELRLLEWHAGASHVGLRWPAFPSA